MRQLPSLFGDLASVQNAFAIEHPPLRNEVSIYAEGAGIHVEGYCFEGDVSLEAVVIYDRQLKEINGELLALHNAFLVDESYQRQGISTQMLGRCLPYYKTIGISKVIIPNAEFDGKFIWPKFGFVLIDHLRERYTDLVKDISYNKTGDVPAEVPVGVGFHEFETLIGGLAKLAIERFTSKITYVLDLTDGQTLKCLRKHGIRL